jgi:maleylpyruvate isomerase
VTDDTTAPAQPAADAPAGAPSADIEALRRATGELLDSLTILADGTDNAAALVTGPSLLPGWTRGHVLTHLARNADSLVNLLTWARTGVETPQYPSRAARDAGIEAGAGRPPAEHLTDLRDSAARLAAAFDAMPAGAWRNEVRRGAREVPAAELPALRLLEVLLHRIDLDLGFGFADLPARFTGRELAAFLGVLAGDDRLPALRVHDTTTGATHALGRTGDPEVTVSGPSHALLGWVTGRVTDGTGLTTAPAGRPLPVLPALG